MTIKLLPKNVNTIVVGNGPSALILSYILHGYIPYYNASNPHPDPVLHHKLSRSPCLLDINVDNFTSHFGASRFSYSPQTLPVNVLLDTLIRPLADTHPGEYESCVQWRYEEKSKTDHIVVGNTSHAGGQWADNSVSASWDTGALSYSEMLSLPDYSFKKHYATMNNGNVLPDFYRPTRREMAEYLSSYPMKVGIKHAVYNGITLDGISSLGQGFYIASHNIFCKNLVLASGIFACLIPPYALLQPLKDLPTTSSCADAPLLVIGSGFTAADVIISAPADRKIVHIYKWDPEKYPSPLRACHRNAYPEYAKMYRQMKFAAHQAFDVDVASFSSRGRDRFSKSDGNYEGLPNAHIKDVLVQDHSATLWLETGDNRMIKREISNFEYVIGRRGSLDYLDKNIREDVLGSKTEGIAISGRSLQPKAKKSLEIAPHIFAIGSLTGDSLIRFAYGGCVIVAKRIIKDSQSCLVTTDGLCSPLEAGRVTSEVEAELEETKIILGAKDENGRGRSTCARHGTPQ